MSGHDSCCPLDDLPSTDCVVCAAIGQARDEEKDTYNQSWRANLPLIERRWYERGYADGRAGADPPARFA